MGRIRLLALVGVLAIVSAAAVTGCSHPHHIAKADYLRRADRICKQAHDRLRAEQAKLDPRNPASISTVISDFVAETTAALEQVRKLGYPKGDATELGDWIDIIEARLQ